MNERILDGAVRLFASCVLPLLLVPSLLLAQQGRLTGAVRAPDAAPIEGAAVSVVPAGSAEPVRVVGTDERGRYRVAGLPPGRYEVTAERLGYAAATRSVTLPPDSVLVLDFTLEEMAVRLEGVTAQAERGRESFEEEAGATIRDLGKVELQAIPGFAEPDPIRAIDLLPGVVTTSDFSGAYNVRGGAADQNLILLDGLPIYQPFHLGGLFSTFNSDIVRRVELMAGGFPAEYGGRVSSVLTVQSDAGGDGFEGAAGISLLASRLALGADLPRLLTDAVGLRGARIRLSGRRSYFDQLLASVVEFPYHLSDLQGYFEAWTPGGGRISVTGYTGQDLLDFTEAEDSDFPLHVRWDWGNDLIGARWEQPFGEHEAIVRAGYTRFANVMNFAELAELGSRIDEALVRSDLSLRLRPRLVLGLGGNASRLEYDHSVEAGGTSFIAIEGAGWTGGLYGQLEWRPGGVWLVELGLRGDGWWPDEAERRLTLSPRLAVKRFFAEREGALKLALGRYTQLVHSLRDESMPIGIDVWIAADDRVPHIVSDQVQAGIERYIGEAWFVSLEGYARSFDGVVANNFVNDPNDPSDDLIVGDGGAYGADLLIQRTREDGLSGWLSASLLKATRTFPDPVSGLEAAPEITYPPIFDRRLDLELVARYPLPWDIDAGLRWNYGSGLPYTQPLGSYVYFQHGLLGGAPLEPQTGFGPGSGFGTAVLLGPRNEARYPAYHRLDVSFRRTFTPRWAEVTPYLQVINVYNQKNVLFYFYDYAESPATRSGYSMFPILPTFGVEVTF